MSLILAMAITCLCWTLALIGVCSQWAATHGWSLVLFLLIGMAGTVGAVLIT